MADPEVSSNNTEYQKLVRAVSDMQVAVDAFAAYQDLERQLADAKEMLRESEGAAPRRHVQPLRPAAALQLRTSCRVR